MRKFEDIQRLVEEQEGSGQSVPAFCAERGLHGTKTGKLTRDNIMNLLITYF